MITDKELAQALEKINQGEVVIAGTILKGLTDEEIAWVVLEVSQQDDFTVYTLHAYWHDIFVVSKVVCLLSGNRLNWGRSSA